MQVIPDTKIEKKAVDAEVVEVVPPQDLIGKVFRHRFQGLSYEEVGRKVQRSDQTIYKWFKNKRVAQAYRVYVEERLALMDQRLDELDYKKIQKLEALLDSLDDNTALRAIDIHNKMTGRYKMRAEITHVEEYQQIVGGLEDEELDELVKETKAQAAADKTGGDYETFRKIQEAGD